MTEDKLNSIIRHIKKVEDNCNVIARKLMPTQPKFSRALIQRGRLHDISKLSTYEYNHLDITDSAFQSALKSHHRKNSHHPEHYNSIHAMSELDIAEMVCDCLARSQEFGSDIKQWFFIDAPKIHKYTQTDHVWKRIEFYLDLLLTPKFTK